MKIALFSKYLPSDKPSGVSVQVDRLASALVARGHAVTCFSLSPSPDKAPYETVPLPGSGTTRLTGKFLPALRFRDIDKRGFDICHYHGDDYLCSGSAHRVRTFYGSALFEALHAGKPGRFFYQAFFYALEWVSAFRNGTLVAISHATRRALPRVVHVIPCGVPLDRFSPDLAGKTSHPSILFIGDFNSRKRGSLLLRAFAHEVLPAFQECRLTVIGPQTVSAPNVVCRNSIGERELIEEYCRAWIYCMPSSYEGFGVPAIEAMACGTAVVACENSGMREVIDDGRNGMLCKEADLGTTLNRLIADTGMKNRLVAEGLMKAREFDMTIVGGKYEDLYKRALLNR